MLMEITDLWVTFQISKQENKTLELDTSAYSHDEFMGHFSHLLGSAGRPLID